MVTPRVRTTRKSRRPTPPAQPEPVAPPAPAKPDMAVAREMFVELTLAFSNLRVTIQQFLRLPALAPLMTDERGESDLSCDIKCLACDEFFDDVCRRMEDAIEVYG